VLSLETLAQDPRNEIMNWHVNQFTLFLSPVLPYTGPETGLVEQFFSTAGARPGTETWHQLYRTARGLRKLQ